MKENGILKHAMGGVLQRGTNGDSREKEERADGNITGEETA